jgi:DNA-binding XRE family transcriptional regulator
LTLKKFRQAIIKQATQKKAVTKDKSAQWFGISRQAYYQAEKRQQQREAEVGMMIEMVQGIRQRHPRMGGRKLYHELSPSFEALGFVCGRDRFFDLLRTHDLLVPTKRNRRRTTRSGLWRCPNLLNDFHLTDTSQVWVGAITYITTEAGFAYLALLTDAFSRYIVGYNLSTSLATEGCLAALQMAIFHQEPDWPGLIHHSDHGVQYTSWAYHDCLQEQGIVSSMGTIGHCYDNALAERMNGILKIEYGLDDLFVDFDQAQQAVWLYNYERPHLSLDYQKPYLIHFNHSSS